MNRGRFLLALLLASSLIWSCSRESRLSPSGGVGLIRVVLSDAGQGVGDHDGDRSILAGSRFPGKSEHRWTGDRASDPIRLDDLEGNVVVNVYHRSTLDLAATQRLTCTTEGGSTRCTGIVQIDAGDYQVSVEVRDTSEVVQYFGLDTEVIVVEGETADATITMTDFSSIIAPEPETFQTGPFSLTWSPVETATSYTLEEDTVASFDTPAALSLAGTSTVIDPREDGLHYYRVRPRREALGVIGRPGNVVSTRVVLPTRPVILAIGSGSGAAGGTGSVPAIIINADSTVAGFQFDLEYDGSVITAVAPTGGDRLDPDIVPDDLLAESWAFVDSIAGHVRYVVYSRDATAILSGGSPLNQTVLNLRFVVNPGASSGESTPLSITPGSFHVSSQAGGLIDGLGSEPGIFTVE